MHVASKEEIEILRKGQKKRYQGRSNVSDCQTNEPIQEKKETKQVASDCRSSENAQESMNNKLSRQINQYDAEDGVYYVPMDKFEILKVAQQNRLANQKKRIFKSLTMILVTNVFIPNEK